MELWHIWVIAAILLFGAEMFTNDLIVGSIGIGCLCSALVARLGAPIAGQLGAFSVGTLLLMAGARPLVKDWLYRSGDKRETGVKALLGREAVVVEAMDGAHAGRVKIEAEEWRAKLEQGTAEEGSRVRVVGVEGATLLVSNPNREEEKA